MSTPTPSPSPALVVLAAGMGSRYGGLKQLDTVGPNGETLLDYAVFDALRAGFTDVVFVIRKAFADDFHQNIGRLYEDRARVHYVHQELDCLPSGFTPPPDRHKPWGTGHAVWCAAPVLHQPFAVINADDFYGADALRQLGVFLQQTHLPLHAPHLTASMVGFRLAQTLSDHGSVSRGVCEVSPAGNLTQIRELTNIERDGEHIAYRDEPGASIALSGAEIVSMNCWGFLPGLFPRLEQEFVRFLRNHGHEAKSEFQLPTAIDSMIGRDEARVTVLTSDAQWFGVTYREDRPTVCRALSALHASGEYPFSLRPSP